jgi:SAM-dependent methyltransferase
MHHQIFLHLLNNKLHLAPIKNPQKILDVGTGTGIWAIDAADMYPSAEVIGIDLSPIQPSWVPPNCRFEVDDCEQDWTFAADSFDFINARNLAQAISNWPVLMSQIYRYYLLSVFVLLANISSATKPGGFVEISDLGCQAFTDDDTMGTGFETFANCVNSAMEAIGRPQATEKLMRSRLEDAGFVDVNVTMAKQPFGPWPKDKRLKNAGAMVLLNCEHGATDSYGLAPLTRILGMKPEEARRICKDGLKDVRNRRFHMYVHL